MENLLKLRLDSREYENKLKSAISGFQEFSNVLRTGTHDMRNATDEETKFVAALGNLATKSHTVSGSMSELSTAIKEMTVMYNELSHSERSSNFGKALNESINTLQVRYKELKSGVSEANSKMGESGGVLKLLSDRIGIPIAKLGTLAGSLAAVKAAFDLSKKAIESSEITHDMYASSVQAMDTVTTQFMRSIATADFSNFEGGLKNIIRLSNEAYASMDEYQSFMARFNPEQQKIEGDIQSLLMKAQASKNQGKIVEAESYNSQADELIKKLMSVTSKKGSLESAAGYDEIRRLTGMNIPDAEIRMLGSASYWEQTKRWSERYRELQSKAGYIASYGSNQAQNEDIMRREEEARRAQAILNANPRLGWANAMMTVRDSEEKGQSFVMALQQIYGEDVARQRIEQLKARIDRQNGVISTSRASSTTAPTGWQGGAISGGLSDGVGISSGWSIEKQEALVKRLKKAWEEAEDSQRGYYRSQYEGANSTLKSMKGGGTYGGFSVPKLAAPKEDTGIDKMQADVRGLSEEWKAVEASISAVGSAMSSIEDPALKVAGIVAQAIATIALAFAQASAMEAKKGWIPWVIASVSGAATMISTIAAVKSATAGSYADGGIIPGTSYQGDRLTANVNSGELILNRAQQNNIAAQLNAGSMLRNAGNGSGRSIISGEQIVTVVNAYGRRTHRGEILKQ